MDFVPYVGMTDGGWDICKKKYDVLMLNTRECCDVDVRIYE